MEEFSDIEARRDKVSDAAGARAAKLIHDELVEIHKAYPDHKFEFWTGFYSPYVRVSPPFHGLENIHAYDLDDRPDGHLHHITKRKKVQALRSRIERMSNIAVYTEDRFGVDIAYVDLDGGEWKHDILAGNEQPVANPVYLLSVRREVELRDGSTETIDSVIHVGTDLSQITDMVANGLFAGHLDKVDQFYCLQRAGLDPQTLDDVAAWPNAVCYFDRNGNGPLYEPPAAFTSAYAAQAGAGDQSESYVQDHEPEADSELRDEDICQALLDLAYGMEPHEVVSQSGCSEEQAEMVVSTWSSLSVGNPPPIDQVREALVVLADGDFPEDFERNTGLPIERCREIYTVLSRVIETNITRPSYGRG